MVDALVATTVAAFGAELVTRDRRAMPVYERYGARAAQLASQPPLWRAPFLETLGERALVRGPTNL